MTFNHRVGLRGRAGLRISPVEVMRSCIQATYQKHVSKGFAMGPGSGALDSCKVCSIGPYVVYGVELGCIGVQIRGPYYGPIGKPLECSFMRKHS